MKDINLTKKDFFDLIKSCNNILLIDFLQKMFGVGYTRSYFLCSFFGYSLLTKVVELNFVDFMKIKQLAENLYGTELFLKREISNNIYLLKKIKSLRGIRHVENLPVRGQRTHTNGWTQKRKRKSSLNK